MIFEFHALGLHYHAHADQPHRAPRIDPSPGHPVLCQVVEGAWHVAAHDLVRTLSENRGFVYMEDNGVAFREEDDSLDDEVMVWHLQGEENLSAAAYREFVVAYLRVTLSFRLPDPEQFLQDCPPGSVSALRGATA